ncbi:DUF1801 domain-containing protein [Calidithermus chliarophilus]|uniref:DUF1801 domain-containing protein n=1 Tax=Calidithermus chliarophilus TaxID=52023 RepID=UPI0003FFEC67|nr:DUF1801 domain-containing protein [Calidithermus chliarophilus]
MEIGELLMNHTPEVRSLVERLRRLVRGSVPEAREKVYPVWRGIGYTHPRAGYFCAIFPQADHVRLGFEFGVLLPDPQRLLEGTGSQVRYLSLRQGEFPEQAVRRLVRAALDLPARRADKLALVTSRARPIGGE